MTSLTPLDPAGKKVHFSKLYDSLDPLDSNELTANETYALQDDMGMALNSPLKATTVLGSTIKKLSPISGAIQTIEAKNAYDRLLQQASLSMFDGDDVQNEENNMKNYRTKMEGEGNKDNVSQMLPQFYQIAAEAATPNSHTMIRLESQQYDYSPPIRGSQPFSSDADVSFTPVTPISSSHKEFIAYREAHKAISDGDIHKQLQSLRQDFVRAQNEEDIDVASLVDSDKNSSKVDFRAYSTTDKADAGISMDSSPEAVAILSAHLSSIAAEKATLSVLPIYLHNPALNDAEDMYNKKFSEYETDQAGHYPSVAHSSEQNDSVIFENTQNNLAFFDSKNSAPESLTNNLHKTKILEPQDAHAISSDDTAGLSLRLSIEDGLARLSAFRDGLDRVLEDLQPRLGALSLTENHSFPAKPRQLLELQTYSTDTLEAKVLQRHQQLMSSGAL